MMTMIIIIITTHFISEKKQQPLKMQHANLWAGNPSK